MPLAPTTAPVVELSGFGVSRSNATVLASGTLPVAVLQPRPEREDRSRNPASRRGMPVQLLDFGFLGGSGLTVREPAFVGRSVRIVVAAGVERRFVTSQQPGRGNVLVGLNPTNLRDVVGRV